MVSVKIIVVFFNFFSTISVSLCFIRWVSKSKRRRNTLTDSAFIQISVSGEILLILLEFGVIWKFNIEGFRQQQRESSSNNKDNAIY